MKKGQTRIDEFSFILLAGIVIIIILTISWSTPTEPAPVITPTTKSLTIGKGMSSSFDINITGYLSNVTLSASGDIKNWVTFSKNHFDIYGQEVVTVKVRVPNSASIGTYNGLVTVQSTGGSTSVHVTVEIPQIVTTEMSSSFQLGDFTVRYASGSKTLDSKEKFDVYTGYFSSYRLNLIGILTDDELAMVKDGYIKLIVEDTNAAGNLVVYFNDGVAYNKVAGLGEIIIPLDKDQIKKSNSAVIGAGTPGWQFWMNTVYRFRYAELVVNYLGSLSKNIPFTLDQDMTSGFQRFILSATTSATSLSQLAIKVNDQTVYYQNPPLAFLNITFDRDTAGNKLNLNAGNNTISFAFQQQASYELRNTVLTVYYLVQNIVST